MKYQISKSNKWKFWLISFLILFLIIGLAFTLQTLIEAEIYNRQNVNWDGVILFNILYSLGLALILSPIGYVGIKALYYKRNNKNGVDLSRIKT
ncbi:hypothetical protein F9U64_06620 [Gracilibacillus oryzae]|uniref:Uncharacterized protein n=1 Tax=Gracilibacillus oryzae TaxID=1672701 RepID=A0A7C8GU39_9BACI|nr:hypothetical protein [Gracilibacillus oryzae]KAB8138113.1 hypothetical protein F9U64_06620 [Gracilibacillus oryzae]